MVAMATVFDGDRWGNVEDCLDAPRTRRTTATGQRRGVDQMTAQRAISAPPGSEADGGSIVADEVVQSIYRASEGQIAVGRLDKMHRATSGGVLGAGRQQPAQGGQPARRVSSKLVGTVPPGVDQRK